MTIKAAEKRISAVQSEYKDDPKKCIKELRKLLAEGKEKNDPLLIGSVYKTLAVVYAETGDYENLFSNALRAIAFLEKTEYWEGLAVAYNNVGYAYLLRENSQMSLAYSDKAYQLVKKHRINGKNRDTLLNNLSTAYHEMGDYKTSIKLVRECIELVKKQSPDDYDTLAMYTINYAEFLKDSGDTDGSSEVLDSMLDCLDKIGFDGIVCDYYLRRAILEYDRDNKKAAGKYMDSAFSHIPADVYPLPIYDDLRELEYTIVRCGNRKHADKIAELMEIYVENCKDKTGQFIALRTLADYYHNTGDSVKAADLYVQVDRLYEERMRELKRSQYNINKMMHETDAEIQRLNRKMQKEQKLAEREPLTGLLNRGALLKTAENFISVARKRKEKVGAIFIDIDFFKEYNDTYGHTEGDEIIRRIARICQKEERRNVRFARYGGDEFFGITHGLSDNEVEEIVVWICESIRKEKITHIKNPNGGRVTISGGAANVAITEQIDTIIEIANYADKAVYHAKGAGKDTAYLLDHTQSGMEFRKII